MRPRGRGTTSSSTISVRVATRIRIVRTPTSWYELGLESRLRGSPVLAHLAHAYSYLANSHNPIHQRRGRGILRTSHVRNSRKLTPSWACVAHRGLYLVDRRISRAECVRSSREAGRYSPNYL